jgi:hypothetical protein
MAKYIDKEVMAITKDQSKLRGILKFFDGSSLGILESGTDRLLVIADSEVQWIQLASLPANFYTKPTLHWSLIAPKKGNYPIQMSYLSGGFSWDVTYNAVWDEKKLELNSWVTIDNRSGRAFDNVNLKLIAGDINQIRDDYYKYGEASYDRMSAGWPWKLHHPLKKRYSTIFTCTPWIKRSLCNNQTKQLELYPKQNVTALAVYEYTSFSSGVKSMIKFFNKEDQGLGKPCPRAHSRFTKPIAMEIWNSSVKTASTTPAKMRKWRSIPVLLLIWWHPLRCVIRRLSPKRFQSARFTST